MTPEEFLEWVDEQCELYPWQRRLMLRLLEEEEIVAIMTPPRQMPHWEDIVPSERFL